MGILDHENIFIIKIKSLQHEHFQIYSNYTSAFGHVHEQAMNHISEGKLRCYAKSPTAQYVVWSKPHYIRKK